MGKKYLETKQETLESAILGVWKEAVSPAQQAAIAISKKERGEKPKKESVLDRIDRKIKEKNDG